MIEFNYTNFYKLCATIISVLRGRTNAIAASFGARLDAWTPLIADALSHELTQGLYFLYDTEDLNVRYMMTVLLPYAEELSQIFDDRGKVQDAFFKLNESETITKNVENNTAVETVPINTNVTNISNPSGKSWAKGTGTDSHVHSSPDISLRALKYKYKNYNLVEFLANCFRKVIYEYNVIY